jgi:hypothetical protein
MMLTCLLDACVDVVVPLFFSQSGSSLGRSPLLMIFSWIRDLQWVSADDES